jgi:membrane protease subunit (stomatin/prohibitin family)
MKYGTPSPVPFRVIDKNIGLDIDIAVKCFGEYSIRVCDPISFYTNVCGNFSHSYPVSEIDSQLKTELLTALGPAFARLSAQGVRYSEIPAHTYELADALNAELSKKWKELRGIEIVSFGVSSIKASEEDERMIKQAQRDAMYRDQSYAAATLVGAQAQAMKDAANNANGAAMGFMGVNMAQNAGGINANQLYANGAAQNTQPAAESWTCPKCGAVNTSNFCGTCGEKKPESGKWICPKCGRENEGNFCGQCGEKKPA